MPSRLTDMIMLSLGLRSRKASISFTRSRKYFLPVTEMGKTLWTSKRPSLEGSSGVSGWTRISKKRTPFSSCSLGDTAWHLTEGKAR